MSLLNAWHRYRGRRAIDIALGQAHMSPKIHAIKAYRYHTRASLLESKLLVESIMVRKGMPI